MGTVTPHRGRGGPPARRAGSRRRGRRLAAAACLAVGAWSAGCGGDAGAPSGTEAPVPEAERRGGTLVVATAGDAQSMNALTSQDWESAQLQLHLLFATLVRADPEFRARPWLAESWEVSDDSTRVTFRLRDDLRWHDGEPLTAEDVAFTFRRIKDPRVPFLNVAHFDYWETVEVLDDRTVRFHVRPHADMFYGWAVTAVMPEHILGDVPPEELATHPFGTTAPVGSGPFRFVERVPADRWVFEANPEFPEALGGPPRLDRIVVRRIPDATTRQAALRAGEVHLVLDAEPAAAERAAADPALGVATFPAPEYAFVAWNTRREAFSEASVRRALALAVDRRTIVETLREGYATVASGPIGPWHWAYDTAWRPLPWDPDSAAVLLTAAGWRDADGDGVRERGGRPFRIELLSSRRDPWPDLGAVLQAQWAAVGVAMTHRMLDRAALGPLVTSPDRRFDAVLLSWSRDGPLDDRDLWACDQVGQPAHFTGWCDPELDPVLDSLRLVTDRERLRRLIDRYREAVSEAQPYTFLYHIQRVDVYRRELRGFEPDVRGHWVGVVGWWLHPAAR